MEKLLNDIMKSFASQCKIFCNESQFQFELALELKSKGCEVELEVLSLNKDIKDFQESPKGKIKKYYTDIVAEYKGKYYAIELKYKTIEDIIVYTFENEKKAVTFSQGAPDLGSILFWHDVERLEELKSGNRDLNFDKNKKFENCFSIILTNDKMYWEGNEKSLCCKYFPVDGQTISGTLNKNIVVNENGERQSGRQKKQGKIFDPINSKDKNLVFHIEDTITLKHEYVCKWVNYELPQFSIDAKKKVNKKNGIKFRYLILKI